MAFKLKSPYEKQTTPIYMVDDEDDVESGDVDFGFA